MKTVYSILILSILASCGHQTLTSEGNRVFLLKSTNKQCKYIDEVSHMALWGSKKINILTNTFKNKVAKVGGNVGVVTLVRVNNSYIKGKAYHCPQAYIDKLKRSIYK